MLDAVIVSFQNTIVQILPIQDAELKSELACNTSETQLVFPLSSIGLAFLQDMANDLVDCFLILKNQGVGSNSSGDVRSVNLNPSFLFFF